MRTINVFRIVSAFYLVAAIISLGFVDNHPVIGLFTVLAMWGACCYDDLARDASNRHKELDNDLYERSSE